MAETLDSFNFEIFKGRPNKYPWDQWTDGRIWRIRRPDDFDIEPKTMKHTAYRVARRRNLKVRTVIEDENTVVFQFLDKD